MRSLSPFFCLLALGLTPVLSLAALTNGKLQVGIVKDEAYLYDKQGKKEPLKTARIFQEGFRVETTPKNTVELILSNGSTLKQLLCELQSPQPSHTASLMTTRTAGSTMVPRLRRRRFSVAQVWS